MELANVPGYRRALQRAYRVEESFREQSYLGIAEKLCGIPVGPLTFQAYLQLDRIGSPFVCGGMPLPHDVAFFLFRLSPAYERARAAKLAAERDPTVADRILRPRYSRLSAARRGTDAFVMVRREFIEQVRKVSLSAAVRAIRRFMRRMLLDRPAYSSSSNASSDPADTSWAADVIHMIATAYHWPRADILALPMPEVFQALRNIRRDQPNCPKKHRAKVHPIASRLTRRHRKIATDAAASAQ
jgi:hypothetical protein